MCKSTTYIHDILYTYIAGTHESSWGCAQICITRTVIWLTHIRRKSQRTIPRKKSRRLYNNNPPWLPHHHRFPPPKKKRETLRIMGSQVTGGFGHPRSQFSLRKKKISKQGPMILREQKLQFFWSRKSSAVIGRYPEISPADAPILSLRIGSC